MLDRLQVTDFISFLGSRQRPFAAKSHSYAKGKRACQSGV